MSGKGRWPLVLGIVVSAVFLLYFFLESDIEWAALGAAFREADYLLVGLSVVLNLLSYPVRAWRWGYLLPGDLPTSFRARLSSTVIGFTATSVLPGRLGEVVRASMIGLKGKVPFGTAFASIVVERLYDLIVVLLGLVLVLWKLPGQVSAEKLVALEWVRPIGAGFGAATVVLIVGLVVLRFFPNLVRNLLERVLSPLGEGLRKKILGFADSIVGGLLALDSVGTALWVFVLSLFHWSIVVVSNHLMIRAFHLDLSWIASLLVFVLVSLAVALPQAPGFIGVYQFVADSSLKIMSAPLYAAKGFALLSWAVSIIPVTLVGFGFLYAEGISLSAVTDRSRAESGGPVKDSE